MVVTTGMRRLESRDAVAEVDRAARAPARPCPRARGRRSRSRRECPRARTRSWISCAERQQSCSPRSSTTTLRAPPLRPLASRRRASADSVQLVTVIMIPVLKDVLRCLRVRDCRPRSPCRPRCCRGAAARARRRTAATTVVAGFYPLAWAAERIAGPDATDRQPDARRRRATRPRALARRRSRRCATPISSCTSAAASSRPSRMPSRTAVAPRSTSSTQTRAIRTSGSTRFGSPAPSTRSGKPWSGRRRRARSSGPRRDRRGLPASAADCDRSTFVTTHAAFGQLAGEVWAHPAVAGRRDARVRAEPEAARALDRRGRGVGRDRSCSPSRSSPTTLRRPSRARRASTCRSSIRWKG